ncbi:MAG: hypothetical protein ACLTSG_02470 [Lachnospiraceae bacterium]
MRAKSEYLFSAFEGKPGIEQVSGLGLMIGLKTAKPAAEVVAKCMEQGVLVLTAHGKVRLLPALNIPMELVKRRPRSSSPPAPDRRDKEWISKARIF